MSEERVCLRCLLRESGGADTLEDIRKRIEKIHAYDKADDTSKQKSGNIS